MRCDKFVGWSQFQSRKISGYSKVSGTKPLRKRENYLLASYKLCQMRWRVKALRYKPKDRGFDSGYCNLNSLFTQYFQAHYGPGV